MLELTIGLAVLFFVLAVVFIVLYLNARKSLRRFEGINDLEKYRDECQSAAAGATADADRMKSEIKNQEDFLSSLKDQTTKYKKVVKDFKSVVELRKHIKELSTFADGCRTIKELDKRIANKEDLILEYEQRLKALGYAVESAESAGDIADQISEKKRILTALKKEIESVEETNELQQFGFYHAKYDFDSSEKYRRRLDDIRADQKNMIKEKTAATCDAEWTVEGSRSKGKKMTNDQIKLLLRSFNGECDAAVAKATYSNVVSLEKRIERSFDQINRMAEVNKITISRHYLELKLQELYLSHEFQEKKQEEKEEQKRIREQMREEEKVERELKKAQESAEKEETVKRKALEQARAELDAKAGHHTKKLEELVAKLENELQEAIDRKAKAIARAQLTKSGHVYVLSNIGSFGETVYKIGMTRRLEPLERVRELGDASVPFPFDVHAMIYSENAPELENKLHRHFASRRVNMINLRREFFRVTLNEVQEAVEENFGDVTFVRVPHAEQYRQTLALLSEMDDENGDALPYEPEVEFASAE